MGIVIDRGKWGDIVSPTALVELATFVFFF
jgi:hypothetical protein